MNIINSLHLKRGSLGLGGSKSYLKSSNLRQGAVRNEIGIFDPEFKGKSGWSMSERDSAERQEGREGRGQSTEGLPLESILSTKGGALALAGML